MLPVLVGVSSTLCHSLACASLLHEAERDSHPGQKQLSGRVSMVKSCKPVDRTQWMCRVPATVFTILSSLGRSTTPSRTRKYTCLLWLHGPGGSLVKLCSRYWNISSALLTTAWLAFTALSTWCLMRPLIPSDGPFPCRDPKKCLSNCAQSRSDVAWLMSEKGPLLLYWDAHPSVHWMTRCTSNWRRPLRCERRVPCSYTGTHIHPSTGWLAAHLTDGDLSDVREGSLALILGRTSIRPMDDSLHI